MITPKDTDLREALRRKYANVPQMKSSLPLSPSKGRGTQSRFSSLSLWRGRGVRLVGAIAASIVIAFILWPDNLVEEQPVIAEVVEEQPVQEAPKVSENSEVSENSDKSEPSEPVKPKRTYKARKAIEEPQLAEAERMPEEAEVKMELDYLPKEPDPFLLAAVEAQDIRSRGAQLFQEVDKTMIKP